MNIGKIITAVVLGLVTITTGTVTGALTENVSAAKPQTPFVEFSPETVETTVTVECTDLNRKMSFEGDIYTCSDGNQIIRPSSRDYEIQIIDGTLAIYDENMQLVVVSHDYAVAHD